MLANAIFGFINGPVFKIIDKLIPDPDLRAKLKAQVSQSYTANLSKFTEHQKDVVVAEITGSAITRTWRPVLMYIIMGFLIIYGFLLPLSDLFLAAPIEFNPRWGDIPDGLWNLLSLGVGGYIGGRSLEKVAANFKGRTHLVQTPQNSPDGWALGDDTPSKTRKKTTPRRARRSVNFKSRF